MKFSLKERFLIEDVRLWAQSEHEKVGQKYGDGEYPYSYHTNRVAAICEHYIHLIPEDLRVNVILAALCHDILEDTHNTYNDLVKVVGTEVADIAYALTNDKGKTRAERAGDKYYSGIRLEPGASFVKLCDRMANCLGEGSMYTKYQKEHEGFLSKVVSAEGALLYKELIEDLNLILKHNIKG